MNASLQEISTNPNTCLASLTDQDKLPNQQSIYAIVAAQRAGKNCLPTRLGLNRQDYQKLVNQYFFGIDRFHNTNLHAKENGDLRQELMELRKSEWQDIVQLLMAHRRLANRSEVWIAQIIAAACLGGDHLWRDLGLPNRESLKELFLINFPTLAAKNIGDMRWKKFLYRQLCEQQGHYVCRSPSCEQCPTFDECFGDEI